MLDAGVESADIGVVYLIRLYVAAFSILALLLTLIAAAPYTFGLPYMFQVNPNPNPNPNTDTLTLTLTLTLHLRPAIHVPGGS